ncbi:MAG: hypothetical protein HY548_02190, partial [Elusimicrobia bacterium]|nr:hypothetical protein [Elusimicrobiota bacterium]
MSGIYFSTQVVGATQVEKNFWAQRRAAVKNRSQAGPSALEAGLLPALNAQGGSVNSGDSPILAQLPGVSTLLNFRPPDSVSLPTRVTQAPVLPNPGISEPVSGDRFPLPSSSLSALAQSYGYIKEFHMAERPGAPLVIHIQDAHEHYEAQKNIASLIRGLVEERGVGLVGLEGTVGGFNLKPYRDFPDRKIIGDISDYFLREGFIGGAESAGWTAAKEPVLWGVEETGPYLSNIQAFKDALPRQRDLQDVLKEIDRQLTGLKASLYSPELRDIDEKRSQFESGLLGLGKYVRHLMSLRPPSGSAVPNLELFVRASNQEAVLDFQQVESERFRLVEALSGALSEAKLSALVEKSLLYRMGHVTYGAYHIYLQELCRSNGVRLERFPQFKQYIDYVLTAERIQKVRLMEELSRLEEDIQRPLLQTDVQKELQKAAVDYRLLKKLSEFALAPEDWRLYENRRESIVSLGHRLQEIGRRAGSPISLAKASSELSALLESFEAFCRLAMGRNDALLGNLMAKMKSDGHKSAVLVAGGFHTEGLARLMRERDVSYLVVTPKISQVKDGTRYLNFFSRDKTPLEKIFAGERIGVKSPIVGSGALWE